MESNTTTVNETPAKSNQAAEILKYFEALNFRDDDLVCVMTLENKIAKHTFLGFAELKTPETIEGLIHANETKDIYLSMAPFVLGSTKRTKENVAAVRHAFCDIDTNGNEILNQIEYDAIGDDANEGRGMIPEPAVVVESSPGKFQVIWAISEYYKRDKVENLNKGIQHYYGTDPATTDCARVLRVAGTRNHKYPEKPFARIIETSATHKEHMPDDFMLATLELAVSSDGPPVVPPTIEGDIVRLGHRDDALISRAGKLRREGMEEPEILADLLKYFDEKCEKDDEDGEAKCKRVAHSACRYAAGAPTTVLVGGNPAGSSVLSPSVSSTLSSVGSPNNSIAYTPEERAKVSEQIKQQQDEAAALSADRIVHWRDNFRSVGELEKGNPIMYIDNFLIEGVTFIGALPSEGKSFLGLSICKALTTGQPFLGEARFRVPKIIPCLYLTPESGARAFRKRCEKFGIPNDDKLFLCRTISEGATLPLNDPVIIEAVKQLHCAVFIDTLIRFNEGDSENDSMQNKQLCADITTLRQMGAPVVVAFHHSTKALRDEGVTLENTLRGTGDIAAYPDCVYALRRDDNLYADGLGPNEVVVTCVKPRDIDPPPLPFRIAFSRRIEKTAVSGVPGITVGTAPGIKSVLDAEGDLRVVHGNTRALEREAAEREINAKVSAAIEADQTASCKQLEKATGLTEWVIRKSAEEQGWKKGKGRTGVWTKEAIFPVGKEVPTDDN